VHKYKTMNRLTKLRLKTTCLALLMAMTGSIAQAQLSDVTQPGDTIVATSDNSPGSEGVTNAIDNADTKYLNFDINDTGLTVTPSVGLTVVSGLALTSANDGPDRDPTTFLLEGSYDGANFMEIASGDVADFPERFYTNHLFFDNDTPYATYRLIFPTVDDSTCCMQIAEIEFLGVQAPGDVTQPGDAIVATSDNSPGSEGVTNAIDNADTKYLNFDISDTGFVVTPSVGMTVVNGLSLKSANDGPDRDPTTFSFEGSYDGVNFAEIASGDVADFPTRFHTNYLFFDNTTPYLSYRVIFPTVDDSTCCMQIAEVELLGSQAPGDVTQPGDIITATSDNSPGSEGVTNAIDNADTKYLNFDIVSTGFTVSPSVGLTIVSGLSLTSANDGPDRDPTTFMFEGSYDGVNFAEIASGDVADFPTRFHKNYLYFDNSVAYLTYRLIFPTVDDSTCCMQIAEVELLGVQLPGDVTQPGDTIIASSDNSPGSEGVTNAIDNADTKYLNFDISDTGLTVTPSVGLTEVIGMSLKSANDGPDRDPTTFLLEGSNDGSAFMEIASGDVADFPERFHTNYIFFENSNPYQTYRLTFPTVDGSTCCMQIAEIELFPKPGGACTDFSFVSSGLITQQPSDTPALAGSTAEIQVTPSGPWNVQWLRKLVGEETAVAIDGATSPVLSIQDVSAEMDGTVYQALVSTPGCEAQLSHEVVLNIFEPSSDVSVGFTFRGSGANGAPTEMLTTDIAGFVPQAYWNNLSGGSGQGVTYNLESGADDGSATDSNNDETEIGIEFATNGTWGAGTRTSNGTGRMLNGIVRTDAASLDLDDSPSEIVLYGLPAGTHSLIVYTVQVPLEFYTLDLEVEDSNGTQRRYLRPENSDEYKPSPNFRLVTSEESSERSVGNMVIFRGLSPQNGEVTLRLAAPDGNGQGPGINGLQILLNKDFVPPPTINMHPVSSNGVNGSALELSIDVSGADQIQWLKDGQAIAGATGASYSIGSLTAGDAGAYSVSASNEGGSISSQAAVVDVVSSNNISEGLVAYFPFDGNADNAVDGGSDGEARNGAGFGSGQIGDALELDGQDDWVFVADYTKPTDSMTVSAWVLPEGIDWGPIVRNWVDEAGDGRFGQFVLDAPFPLDAFEPSLRARIGVGPNEPTASTGISDSDRGSWHHIAMSANGRAVTLYWDGQAVASLDYLNNINEPPFPWLAIGADVVLPTDEDDALDFAGDPEIQQDSYPWAGSIDDLAIWNRSLSAPELFSIFEAGGAGKAVSAASPVLDDSPGVEPSVAEIAGISVSEGNIVIEWTGSQLLESDSVTGPFTPIGGATPPSTSITIEAGNKFIIAE